MPRTFKDYNIEYFNALEKWNTSSGEVKENSLTDMLKYAVLMEQTASTREHKLIAWEQRARLHYIKDQQEEAAQFSQKVLNEDPTSFLCRLILYEISVTKLVKHEVKIDDSSITAGLLTLGFEKVKVDRKVSAVLRDAEELLRCFESNLKSNPTDFQFLIWMVEVMVNEVMPTLASLKAGYKAKDLISRIYRCADAFFIVHKENAPEEFEGKLEYLFENFLVAKTLYLP